jgi:adenylate cyclase
VRFQEGDPLLLRRDACLLHGCGQMALGVPFGEADAPIVAFEVSGTHGLE